MARLFSDAKSDIAALSLAHSQAVAISGAIAFNVAGYSKRRKVNQWLTRYSFPDASELRVSSYGATAVSAELEVFSTTHNANRRS